MVNFTIADYIWYIVGGLALLFILIGFIADKAGLAKRAFSRENQLVKVKEDSVKNPVSTNEVKSPDMNEEKQDLATVSDPVSEEKSNELLENSYEESNDSAEEKTTSTTNVSNQNTLYLNETEVPSDESMNDLEKAYLEAEESTEEAVDNETKDLSEISSSIASEDAESEWGISPNDIEDSKNHDDIELPNLEDLNADTDEDVWKF